MKALVIEEFAAPLTVQTVSDPLAGPDAVVVEVKASGLCRSDWHAWMGHDHDIVLPHVPGHELAGIVVETGCNVKNWQKGDRITVPFVGGCGLCEFCKSGNQQVCNDQFQPGFTHWGSFAEYVAIHYADTNLVSLPDELDDVVAAALGCRFVTAYRALIAQGRLEAGLWLAVYGCGGVGLSAIIIAAAIGARIIAVDINQQRLALAASLGAEHTLYAMPDDNVVSSIREISQGGVHVSLDALGSRQTCQDSIRSLRKLGRHVQVGLMVEEDSYTAIPMADVIANELEILGSHGMQAHQYQEMFTLILPRLAELSKLVGKTINLSSAAQELMELDRFAGAGITVINQFG